MYAVITTGGKQYLVKEGQTLAVEKLLGDVGASLTFANVLLTFDEKGEQVQVGAPHVASAKVEGTILEQGKGEKVVIVKYKPKVHYRRKRGHRQLFTKVKIEKIVV